jgi:hypothetical protein
MRSDSSSTPMHSNLSILFLTGAVLVGTLIGPGAAFAARDGGRSVERSATSVCGRLDSVARELLQGLTERTSRLSTVQREQRSQIEEGRTSLDSVRTKNRVQGDANAERQFQTLEAMASTTAEQDAVQAFRTAVSAALTARRLAFDRALAEYRNGLDQAVDDRAAKIEALRTAVVRDAQAELAKAKASCASGADAGATRTTLIASLRSIQERFQTERKALEQFSESVATLVAARQNAIDAADATLRTALMDARREFTAVFSR